MGRQRLRFAATFAAGLVVGAAALALLRPASRAPPSPAGEGADGLFEAELAMERPVPKVWLEAVPLDEAIDLLRPIAGVPIDVDQRSLEAGGIDPKTPVTLRCRNLPLREVLARVLDAASTPAARLGAEADPQRVRIGTLEELARHPVVRVYDVRDLTPPRLLVPAVRGQGLFSGTGLQEADTPAGDALADLIQETVAVDSWREGGGAVGTIVHFDGRLAVVQTPSNHRALRDL